MAAKSFTATIHGENLKVFSDRIVSGVASLTLLIVSSWSCMIVNHFNPTIIRTKANFHMHAINERYHEDTPVAIRVKILLREDRM